MSKLILFFVHLVACDDWPDRPSVPENGADQIITADFTGTGVDEVVTWSAGTLAWSKGSQAIDGRMISHSVGAVGGDKDAVAMVFGRSKQTPKAEPTAWLLTEDGISQLEIDATRFTDVQVVADGVVVTVASKDKTTRTVHVAGASSKELTRSIMGLSARRLNPEGLVAVGRLYGDRPRSDGGLEIHQTGHPPRKVETVRGVRTLANGDVDGDGHDDLVFADGWHFRYAREAEARIGVLPGPDFKAPIRIGQISDSYTIDSLEVVRPGEILAVGTTSIVLFAKTGMGWEQRVLGTRGAGGIPAVWNRRSVWLGGGPSRWIVFGDASMPPIQIREN